MASTAATNAVIPPTPLYEESAFPEKEMPEEEDLETFKQQVSEWVKLDEQVQKLNIAIRERKIHQKALGLKIQEFMIKFGYTNLNTAQGIIKSNVRNVKVPLKLMSIKSELEKLGDTLVPASELVKTIFEAERPSVVKQSLNRRKPTVSMNLEI
uniref:Uncharacterized protein n=1 Tax=viral metagenome TaxID=1070528 RepID=A0A6C0KUX7_9ZZZZ